MSFKLASSRAIFTQRKYVCYLISPKQRAALPARCAGDVTGLNSCVSSQNGSGRARWLRPSRVAASRVPCWRSSSMASTPICRSKTRRNNNHSARLGECGKNPVRSELEARVWHTNPLLRAPRFGAEPPARHRSGSHLVTFEGETRYIGPGSTANGRRATSARHRPIHCPQRKPYKATAPRVPEDASEASLNSPRHSSSSPLHSDPTGDR